MSISDGPLDQGYLLVYAYNFVTCDKDADPSSRCGIKETKIFNSINLFFY